MPFHGLRLLCHAVFCLLILQPALLFADEIRPGYLELREIAPETFSLLWKVPARPGPGGTRKLSLQIALPPGCRDIQRAPAEAQENFQAEQFQAGTQLVNNAWIQRRLLTCDNGLLQKTIRVHGLQASSTDVLLRLELLDGSSRSVLLTPVTPAFTVPAQASALQIAATYTRLGFTHILIGFDHLLFVFALLLIVRDRRRLVLTITAFTLAHSITLAGATLGLVHMPQQPVEAVIALSILFLAVEIVHGRQGHPGAAARWPWLVALVFGLLHGFGFAGALAEVGLPQQAITLALVFFNIGVELGQLAFVFGVLLAGALLHRLQQKALLAKAETVAVYGIGALSSFWLIERMASF